MKISNKEIFGLGSVPIGIGAALKGWDMTEEQYRSESMLPVVDLRVLTSACPHECPKCFTDKQASTLEKKKIINIIDQLADLNTYAINFLGEGEPTIDPNFFEIIEYTQKNRIIPVIFTDAATKLSDEDFVKRLFDAGATICPKCDSLYDEKYQNECVGDITGQYFKQRNEALELLMKHGFNKASADGSTRLGFDMVTTKGNLHDVERTLRFVRENNLWTVFVTYLPSGRSGDKRFDRSSALSKVEKRIMRELVMKLDRVYNFNHEPYRNFITTPCVEFMQIYGDGRVSPCPGNELVIGNINNQSIEELATKLIERFPGHDRTKFDGHCGYRQKY
jgi:MoaA/NifB/PqqE/SkfB family radical SAM enzyme